MSRPSFSNWGISSFQFDAIDLVYNSIVELDIAKCLPSLLMPMHILCEQYQFALFLK